MKGPLVGVKVIEFAGLGPGPFTAMMLADMGADVIRVHRSGSSLVPANPVVGRGMQSIVLDLKTDTGCEAALRLMTKADAIVEAFRPGVMERLGLGPDAAFKRNPRLVYGRMTGWGQYGPLVHQAGHDINYIALTGALAAIGTADSGPIPPLNLVGDFGGGGMVLAFGIACALFEATRSGKGQVIDAAMTDGASLLMTTTFGQFAAGRWQIERECNLLDGSAPFYSTYRCADGKWIAVGAIEPQFYSVLLKCMGLKPSDFEPQHDRTRWAEWKKQFAACFASRTRDAWCAAMNGADACFTPVLNMAEALEHPHNVSRQTFVEIDGIRQPAPAPRFSRTTPQVRSRQEDSAAQMLSRFGFDEKDSSALLGGR
ncbi:MAG: CaiB/BaiF CoA-transferase family protein [Hydrogenophaga sp.]|nr:CaiB/BaiF CoA-transferase family protein [Hydrogenophaga sp.]